ncbi:MAG: multicopper oxidase family protein [Christensenellales bacterium]
MKITLNRSLVKPLSLAMAAGLIVTSAWMPATTLAQGMMGGMSMMHSAEVKLVQEQGNYRPLRIPAILEPDETKGSARLYTLTMDEGQTEFREGSQTATLGYNGSYLGPTLVLNKGEDIKVTLRNQMDEETTVHWHGFLVPSSADGGPHQVVEPGAEREVAFSVKQEAATLWYHPHTMGKTAGQVYGGLAGFILIKDDSDLSKALPAAYGVDDVPLVVQDRSFTGDMQFDYPGSYNPDGTLGDTLLVNGTIHAAFEVTSEWLRLRLLNGSNARIYDFHLNDGRSFLQIASDGGLLNEPVAMQSMRLTPGERAEILLSLKGMKPGEYLDLMSGETSVLRLNVAGNLTQNGSVPLKLNQLTAAADNGKVDRRFVLFGMGEMVSINGDVFDMNRVDERGMTNQDEVWEVYNRPDMMGGMVHSFHLHGTQFRILTRDGALPPLNEQGWKDTVALDAGERVRLLVRFDEPGLFMYHCHILEHEDNGMMGQIEVIAQ